MNYLDILCFLVILGCAFLGLYQGFLRSSANAGAILCGLLGGSLFWRIVARGFVRGGQLIPTLLNFSESDEFLMGAGETYGQRLMADIANIRTPVSSLEPGFLERLTPTLNNPIIEPFGTILERNVSNLAFEGQATMLGEYLSLSVAYFATAVVSFMLVFVLCTVVFLFIAALADHMLQFPVLKYYDSLAGAGAGVISGLLILMAAGLLIPVILSFVSVPFLQEMVETSLFAKLIYHGNPLIGLFTRFVG